ncbi:fatty acid desaturase [Coniochaeta sp. 2T2.1]|nr:fatty acid desaturase [Coniochaeta sp. 2T2.1]
MDRDRILTPWAVEGLIADGQVIVILDDYVLRLDSWLAKHPGGRLAILHMVGKDATDEIKVYHSPTTLKTMAAYRIGRKAAGPWTNMTPPIRGGIYCRAEPCSDVGSSAGESDGDGDTDTTDDDGGSVSERTSVTSFTSRGSSVEQDCKLDSAGELRRRIPGPSASAVEDECPSSDRSLAGHKPQPRLTAAQYTDFAVQQGVDLDVRTYPSVDPATQNDITAKYRLLHQRIKDAGLYHCPYLDYGKEMARYSTLFAVFLVALHYEWYITSAMFLGLFWHQIMFTAHDAGHVSITHNFTIDSLIAIFIADFCCGLSMGWWKSSHNVHHLITNMPEHDPDIQNVPLFATCPSFFKSVKSTYYDNFVFPWDAVADIMVPLQHYTYYPVMGIARFNLYLLSWLHVLSPKSSALSKSKVWWIRPTEITFMACYWFLFGYLLLWRSLPTWTIRVVFVLVSHIITMPLHVQITLSHWGMSHADLGESESFPQRQLRTTMDVDCPAWLDFIHGGLQFQAVHHLFPRLPRHNLRKAQVHVREFCKETGIPYEIFGFVEGNKKVLGRLEQIGQQVRVMMECQKYMAETGESGLH